TGCSRSSFRSISLGEPEIIATQPQARLDDALLEAALAIYGAMRPSIAALYHFSREPDRAKEVLQRLLSGPGRPVAEEEASANEVLGQLLRNEGDFDGARINLFRAIRLWQKQRQDALAARAYYDLGLAETWQGRWRLAMWHYWDATKLDPQWPAP